MKEGKESMKDENKKERSGSEIQNPNTEAS
jgi:hypothetical protein